MKKFAQVRCRVVTLTIALLLVFGAAGYALTTMSDNIALADSVGEEKAQIAQTDKSNSQEKKESAKSAKSSVESKKSAATKADKSGSSKKAGDGSSDKEQPKEVKTSDKEAKTIAAKTKSISAEAKSWLADTDCLACHADVKDSLDGKQGCAETHADLGCESCHTDVDELVTIHQETKKTTPGKIRRLKTPVGKETCLSCHGSFEDLAEKTESCTVLTDVKGTTVNPHAIPENGEHNTEPACTTCHGVHKDVDPQEYCKGCHHVNEYVCYTCHD